MIVHAQRVTKSSPRLEADAIRDLVTLRLMLDDATRRATASHTYSRGAAVVALDAAVERVSYLVVLRRSLKTTSKPTLDDLYSALVQSYAGAWKPTVWGQIRNLREARNGAQHQGLIPAGENVLGWVAAARAYVTSLVEAEYGVDLDRVALAEAIRNEHLAGLMRTADDALAEGDVPGSVTACLEAFDSAVAGWSRMHGRSRHAPNPSFHHELGFIGDDTAGKAISDLQRTAAEASFASNAAEHEWFQAARKEPRELLDADDSERILAFTFSWVAALELAMERWVPDRRHRADVAARQVRTTDDRASIAAILSVTYRPPFADVTFQLADVPAEGSYDHWASTLGRLLGDPAGRRWWVAPNGTVILRIIDGTVPTGEDVNDLVRALTQVEDALEADAAHHEQAAADLVAQKAEHERTVDAVRDRLPDWVTSLSWENRRVAGTEQGWRFTVTPEVAALRFLNPGGVPEHEGVWKVIRTDEAHCIVTGRNEAYFSATLKAAQVADVLAAADMRLRQRLAETERESDAQNLAVRDIQADLAAALARTQGEG